MKTNKIDNLKIIEANTFYSKFIGLMFKKNIDYGLLLKNTNGIHTFFMLKTIDVILLDKNMLPVKLYENLKPWRVILPKKNVKHTLELPKGYGKKYIENLNKS